MNGLISVIVPVYNCDRYLPKCLDSILSQSYKNIEIICIDDKSTDNSLGICETYSEKDKRIRIIKRKSNGGLSCARNMGIDASKGDYIAFVDSDDWIDKDFIKVLYENMVDNDADLSVASISYSNIEIPYHGNEDVKVLTKSGKELLLEMFVTSTPQPDTLLTIV